jgi:hypothetical protein
MSAAPGTLLCKIDGVRGPCLAIHGNALIRLYLARPARDPSRRRCGAGDYKSVDRRACFGIRSNPPTARNARTG